MRDFKQLLVWQKAHQLVLDVYAITAKFPKSELFGLTSQMRRAAVSVAANIVEGRAGKAIRSLADSWNSRSALLVNEYYSILAADLRLLDAARAAQLGNDAIEVRRMLCGLGGTLERRKSR